mmetsp:Transcript_62105/g.148123  ORF Transcript_62105/g.148123 Transcript_62105/m.148123 type:complete len:200 (+) Transcript_62105:138-737(+)
MRLGLLFAALLSSQAVALRPRNAYEVEAQELHDEEQQHAHNSSLAAESLAEASASEALHQFRELVASAGGSSSDSSTPDAVLAALGAVFTSLKKAWDGHSAVILHLGKLAGISTRALRTAINRIQLGLAQMVKSCSTFRSAIGSKTAPMTAGAISQRFLFDLGLMSSWYVQMTALLRGITSTQYNAQPTAPIYTCAIPW